MAKQKPVRPSAEPANGATDIGRGQIRHNFLAAAVTSKAFKAQVVKAKKGKGAYQRKEKHKGRESCLIAA